MKTTTAFLICTAFWLVLTVVWFKPHFDRAITTFEATMERATR